LHTLSLVERLIAARQSCFKADSSSQFLLWLRRVLANVVHSILWFVHGCPTRLNRDRSIDTTSLAVRCQQAGWSFLLSDATHWRALEFMRRQRPDLVVMLGEPPAKLTHGPALSFDLIRAVCDDLSKALKSQTLGIRIEYVGKDGESELSVCSLSLPLQPFDGPLGLTLKGDLILDDLLLQTAVTLRTGTPFQASQRVAEWARKVYSPSLGQLGGKVSHACAARQNRRRTRYRSAWKLCLWTLFLFSPRVLARNWYRRWRHQYPVLILAHHLISDRPHRMAMSTEEFWRHACFLQKHYKISSLSQAGRLLQSGTSKLPTVALTFDDGYSDNFLCLRAVTEEMEMPVTLFVALQPLAFHCGFEHDLKKGLTGFLPLTWDQVRHWQSRGGEFGSHTLTHMNCGCADRAVLHEEIVSSRRSLEEHLGKPVDLFAFPFGKNENISAQAAALAASTYAHFVSSFGGENMPRRDGWQQHLLRKGLHTSLWESELELQSVFDLRKLQRAQPHFILAEHSIVAASSS